MRRRLEHAPELLDAARHDAVELEQSLDQVAEVNRLLGGQRAVWLALKPLLAPAPATTILDLGTGSADLPLAIWRRAVKAGLAVRVTATDLHPQMREIAQRRTLAVDAIEIGAADALDLPYHNDSFDVVLLSLTLHHFEHADQIRALREAARVARRSIIVNELERCRPNYWGARLLAATRWRGNRLTRHDGPLSVLRAFTQAELASLAAEGGLGECTVDRRYFFRLVMRVDVR
jgi:ubiquinone/menaquinone biosynthesis C-methylase UbiE